MLEHETWADFDEYDYIYYRFGLCDDCSKNINGLKWLYDDD